MALGCGALVLLVPLLCVGSWAIARAMRNSRAEEFRAACAAASGSSYTSARSSLTTVVPGRVVTVEGFPHDPNGGVTFQVHTGIGSFARCEIALSADRVVGVGFDEGHDLDSCNDHRVYPRRHWLCAAGTRLFP